MKKANSNENLLTFFIYFKKRFKYANLKAQKTTHKGLQTFYKGPGGGKNILFVQKTTKNTLHVFFSKKV